MLKNAVHTEIDWTGIEYRTAYQVYKGMIQWLKERDIEHRFEYKNGSHLPCAVIMDAESTIAFKFIF